MSHSYLPHCSPIILSENFFTPQKFGTVKCEMSTRFVLENDRSSLRLPTVQLIFIFPLLDCAIWLSKKIAILHEFHHVTQYCGLVLQESFAFQQDWHPSEMIHYQLPLLLIDCYLVTEKRYSRKRCICTNSTINRRCSRSTYSSLPFWCSCWRQKWRPYIWNMGSISERPLWVSAQPSHDRYHFHGIIVRPLFITDCLGCTVQNMLHIAELSLKCCCTQSLV